MPETLGVPLQAHLHHLEFGSPDPERLAHFYGDAFDMSVERSAGVWVCRGKDRCLSFSEGPAKSLISAGYEVVDQDVLASLSERLTAAGWRHEQASTALFDRDAVCFRDPDGHQIIYGLGGGTGIATGMPARLQHLVVASRDAEAMVDFYTRIVGLRISDRVLDDAGVLRTCFMRTDDEHHSFAVFQAAETRLDHHCYEAVDWNLIRDWGDRFAARRIPVKWGPGRHGPGNNLFLFIHDPDGNWVEISAELEVVGPDRPAGVWPHEERTLNTWGQAFLRS